MRALPALVLVVALAASCGKPAPVVQSLPQQSPAAAPEAAAPRELPWIEDDFDGALASARAQGKPLVVDAWALWCHTCLSMKSFVLTDPALAPLADRFVFAAIDTEKPVNEGFITKYPIDAYPTFFVLDPADGSVASRWLGSMSVNQVRAFLEDGERTVQLAHAGQIPPDDPLFHLRAGDRASLDKKHPEAARHYAGALAAAPATWPRRAEALNGQLRALSKQGDHGACVELALEVMDTTGTASNAADFAIQGMGCAEELPDTDPRVARVRRAGLDKLVALVEDPAAPLSADDRGDIWRIVWDLRETAGDQAGAKDAARARLAVLEAAVKRAPDAQAASTFDWARAETLLYLDRGADAIAMLEKSEAGLPADYNPPSRLARVYLMLGQHDAGLAAIERALGKAYGPRKSTLLATKADLLEKSGKLPEARAVLEEQLVLLRGLPVRRAEAEKKVEERLSKIEAR